MPTINNIIYGFKFDSPNITYSLKSVDSKWDGQDNETPTDFFDGKNDLSASWKTSFGTAISLWDGYSNFSITEETLSGADANIYAYRADLTQSGATTAWFDEIAEGTEYFEIDDGGYERSEIVFDNAAITGYDAVSGMRAFVLLHEMGHALGLRGDIPISGDFTTDMSVVSYNIPGAGYAIVDGEVEYASLASGRFAATPMAYDIAALEELYGPTAANTDGTEYSVATGWFTGGKRSLTILDTDGVDTFDLSGYTAGGVTLDLRETLGPNDEWYDLKSIVGDERVFIARGTVIENAIGTSSNDALQGNATANHLEGGGGLDALNGDAGDDTLEGGANSDTYLFTGAFGNDTIIDSDADGELVIDNKIYSGTAALSGSYEWKLGDLTFSQADPEVDDITVTRDGDALNSVLLKGFTTASTKLGITLQLPTATILDAEYNPNAYTFIYGTAEDDTFIINRGTYTIVDSAGNDTYIFNPQEPSIWQNGMQVILEGGQSGDKLQVGDYELSGSTLPQYLGEHIRFTNAYQFLDEAYLVDARDMTGPELGEGGYNNPFLVVIKPGTASSFGINWTAGTTGSVPLPSVVTASNEPSEPGTQEAYGDADTSMQGGDFTDHLIGAGGDDTLSGGAGDDTLYGKAGNDSVSGGLGNDSIIGGSGAGDDTYDGGDGIDVVTYSSATLSVLVDLGGGSASGSEIGNDTLVNIENAVGGSGNDTMEGSGSDNSLTGGAGNDSLYGEAGNDSLDGQDNDDYVLGGAGNDIIFGRLGNDSLDGGFDHDTVYGGDGQDTVWGWTGDDSLFGDAGNDSLLGGSGNDSMDGGTDNDYLSAGEGDDTLLGGVGNDDVRGGSGVDWLTGNAGQDIIQGDGGDDLFVFLALSDSVKLSDDRIRDFTHGEDTIVLTGLGFTGVQAGTGNSTVLGYAYSSTTNRTYVSDGADFRFFLDGNHTLSASDFIFA